MVATLLSAACKDKSQLESIPHSKPNNTGIEDLTDLAIICVMKCRHPMHGMVEVKNIESIDLNREPSVSPK
jgi:hypothetical protein